MRTPQFLNLPVAEPTYSHHEEQVMRRTVEQALTELREDIRSIRDGSDSESSLANRRRDFLLMGG